MTRYLQGLDQISESLDAAADFLATPAGVKWKSDVCELAKSIYDQRVFDETKEFEGFKQGGLVSCFRSVSGIVKIQDQFGGQSIRSLVFDFPKSLDVVGPCSTYLSLDSGKTLIFPSCLPDLRGKLVSGLAFDGAIKVLNYLGVDEIKSEYRPGDSVENPTQVCIGLRAPTIFTGVESFERSEVPVLRVSQGDNYSADVLNKGLLENSEKFIGSELVHGLSIKDLKNRASKEALAQNPPPFEMPSLVLGNLL